MLGFLERQSTVSSFSFQVLFQTSDAPTWVSRIQTQTRKSHSEQSQRHQRYSRCVLWEVTMYAHLPFKKLGFLAVQLWPIFPLKYSLTRTLLQLEFRWSKPDESHSEKSETETRKTAFCSSKTPKSRGDDGLAAAGCPVSNPDNNCANGLLVWIWSPSLFLSQIVFNGDATQCCAEGHDLQIGQCGAPRNICEHFYDSAPSGRYGTMTYISQAVVSQLRHLPRSDAGSPTPADNAASHTAPSDCMITWTFCQQNTCKKTTRASPSFPLSRALALPLKNCI